VDVSLREHPRAVNPLGSQAKHRDRRGAHDALEVPLAESISPASRATEASTRNRLDRELIVPEAGLPKGD
jgi:hypothetical protein